MSEYGKLGVFCSRQTLWRHVRVPKILEGAKTTLEFFIRHKNRWEVVGACVYDDTMSRRSNQLLLTAENDHFEGSMLLKEKEGIMPRFVGGGVIFFIAKKIS